MHYPVFATSFPAGPPPRSVNPETQSPDTTQQATRLIPIVVILALVGLVIGLAPLGLAAFAGFITTKPVVLPYVALATLPFWGAVIAATLFARRTRSAKSASALWFILCGLTVLNFGGWVAILSSLGNVPASG